MFSLFMQMHTGRLPMFELTIEMRTDSDKCLYEQIYDYIKQEIRSGRLEAGERLPSTRSLAEHLQISRSTADLAYDQLVSEGYIEAKPYKGYFVCRIDELLGVSEGNPRAEGFRAEGARTEGFRTEGIRAEGSRQEQGGLDSLGAVLPGQENPGPEPAYDFSPTKIDMTQFPFSVWKKITKNILSDSNAKLFSKGDVQGDLGLRETIAKYLHTSRGVNCGPEQIVVGAGNDYLLMLLEKILGERVSIAMENPTYLRAYKIFQSFHYPITTIDTDENGLRVDMLERTDASLVYVMPSHQYPTGTVMPIGRRNELLKWANQSPGRFLIEDDYDSEFRYKGKPIPSLQASDKSGKVIYMGTFSKSIAPAIRVSYMVLPRPLLERYRQRCYFYSTTVSRIDQKILDEFIRGGYFERYLNKMRKVYKDKHDLLLEALKPFEKQFEITGENAGLHLLLTSRQGVSEKELMERARKMSVKVYGLSESFCQEEQVSYTVILGYGNMTEEEILAGVERLSKAWKIQPDRARVPRGMKRG